MKTLLILSFAFFILQQQHGFAQWQGTNPIYTSSGVKVGIGTPTPNEPLAVKTSVDGNLASFIGANSGLVLQSNTPSFDIVGYSSTSGYKPILFRSGTYGLLVNTNGYIGVGTSYPLTKLDINGNGTEIMNSANKIIDSDKQDMISVQSLTKASTLNLVSSRTTAGPLGGVIFTTTNGWADSHRNVAGIVGGSVGTDVTAGGYLSFWTKNGEGDIPKEKMRISHDGNVGIGTTSPAARLDVLGQSAMGLKQNGTTTDFEVLSLYNTSAGTTASGNGAVLQFYNSSSNYNGVVGSSIKSVSSNSQYGWESDLYLRTTKNNSFSSQTILNALVIKGGSGNVGIGTTSPDARLAVKGTIHSQEVKVDMLGPMVPDYVFEKDYNLLSLDSIKTYIDQHKHLPEVPSAKEMEANGMNLGEMNILLLKKMEEMTLYMIKQNEVVHELRTEVNKLKRIKLNRRK